jgi:hypothetical protein
MQIGSVSLQCTAHARARMEQRAIDETALETLLEFGRAELRRRFRRIRRYS